MGFKNEEELKAFTDWARDQLEGMGRHVNRNGIIKSEIVGRCVWALPHRLFIGKVWPKEDRTKAYWIISGENVPTDHMESRLAESPRTAARHFALKWQLDGARVASLSDHSDAEGQPDSKPGFDWQSVGDNLESQAEKLYALTVQEELWENTASVEELLPSDEGDTA